MCNKDLREESLLDQDVPFGPQEGECEDYLEVCEDYDGFDGDVYQCVKSESSAGSWTSLILGIISSLGWIVPIIGLPVTIVGTVFGAINMKNRKSKGVAIAGFVVNIVFLCASIAKGIIDIIMYVKKCKK